MMTSAKAGETMTETQLRLCREAQERGGKLCGPERGWITSTFDASRRNRTGWLLAHVWSPRSGSGWRARVDTMIVRYEPTRTVTAESYVIQSEGGFGRTHEFATVDEAQAYCDRVIAMSVAS